MWRSVILFVVLTVVPPGRIDAENGCSCSSTCKPKITVQTSKGKKDGHGQTDHRHGDNELIRVASLPIWEYPCGAGKGMRGAPSYTFIPVTHQIEVTGSWFSAYRYCKALGSYSNLLWIGDYKEFQCVREWVVKKLTFPLPIGITMAVWTGGQKTFAVPNPIYRWNFTRVVVDNNFWQMGAPNGNDCVGMNPYSIVSSYLNDYKCSQSVPNFQTFTGWVCKRQVLPDP